MLTSRPRARHARRRRIPLARTVGAVAVLGASAGASLALAGPAQAASGSGVLEQIKACESGGDYTAHNPSSTASGAYQFLDSTWRTLPGTQGYSSAADAPAAVQDKVAAYTLATQGTTPWAASKHCWAHGGGSLTSGKQDTQGTQDTRHTQSSDISRFFTDAGSGDSANSPDSSGGWLYHWRGDHLYWTHHPDRAGATHYYSTREAAESANR